MKHTTKLYCLTPQDFMFPWSLGRDGVKLIPGDNIAQLLWPDGSPCWLANLYLLHGFRKGRSRRNQGGTLLTWAKNLSPLLRWCYDTERDFFELEDADFVAFVNYLSEEKRQDKPDTKVRGVNQIRTIAGAVMSFFAYIDSLMPGLNLIGPQGSIKAELKQVEFSKGGKKIKALAWTHDCLPRGNPTRRRQPISADAIEKLYEANDASGQASYLVRRRFIMLRLFELTGGRRIEVSFITLTDLHEAEQTGQLKIFSAKKRDDAYRYVPVTKADLKEILSFVKHYRRLIINKTIGMKNDHGYLFVSSRSGKPLEVDTLSAELYLLRMAAGIYDEEACLHAFRHRYITNTLRILIRMHRCENISDLKRAMLSIESIKQQLLEWTGQSSLDALERYVHLAFEAETGFKDTLDVLQAGKVVESLHFIIKDYRNKAQSGGWTSSLFDDFETAVSAAQAELSQLLNALSTAEVKS
jgi:integrase